MNVAAVLCVLFAPSQADKPPWEQGSRRPAWHDAPVRRDLTLKYDAGRSPRMNGNRLADALGELRPGDRLRVGPGVYVFGRKVTLNPRGAADAPIRVEAADPKKPPVLTRPDAKQNLLNVGEGGPSRFLLLRGLELKGGSVGVRLGDCADLWIDRCHIHHAGHNGLTANTRDTTRLYVTNNHMHHFLKGTGEAMYLGANRGKRVMSFSVIAGNHVHDCAGSQGDGIEVKQGSHHNWVVDNRVHDTKYPGVIAYGTGGRGVNVIERNVVYRSKTQGMQVQGEAVVRDNLIMAAAGDAFLSTDHQGRTENLRFEHNTIITPGRGANLSSWAGRDGMTFADNVVYSRAGVAVRFPSGCRGVTARGNVVLGRVAGCRGVGFTPGRGLQDFRDATWGATKRDATPAAGGPLGAAGVRRR